LVAAVKKVSAAIAANHWITRRQTWLYASAALMATAVMVLAGFGFYYLFIFNDNSPVVADMQAAQDNPLPSQPAVKTPPPTAMEAEKKALVTPSKDAAAPSIQPIEPAAAKKLSRLSPPSEPVNAAPAKLPSKAEPASPPPAATGKTISGKTGPPPGSTSAAVNLSVGKASICSGIKDRMPSGVGSSFPSSVERIYVWSQVAAKQFPTKIRHIYYLEGRKISDVSLDIRSALWRTWSFKSISNDRYRGAWRVDIASADGTVLRRLYFDIR
jgi:hypothetical protein